MDFLGPLAIGFLIGVLCGWIIRRDVEALSGRPTTKQPYRSGTNELPPLPASERAPR